MTGTRRLFCLAILASGWLLSEFVLVRPVIAQTKPAADVKTAADEEWNVIYMGKTRVGYSRSNTLNIKRDDRELIRSESETMMLIKRFGQELKMKLTLSTEETLDGQLVSVEFKNENPPASFTRTTGQVNGDKLELSIANAGKTSKKSVAFADESSITAEITESNNKKRPTMMTINNSNVSHLLLNKRIGFWVGTKDYNKAQHQQKKGNTL